MNQFTKVYQRVSNLDLLRVLENSEDYQPEAVDAAKIELKSRNLSEEEMDELKMEVSSEREKKEQKAEKKSQHTSRSHLLSKEVLDSFHTVQDSSPGIKKQIFIISIAFGSFALYRFYNQFDLISALLSDSLIKWDLTTVLYFFPLFILPIAVVLFWREKKAGWILLTIFLTYSAFEALIVFIMFWDYQPLNTSILDGLLPQVSFIIQFLAFLIFGGTLWVISRSVLRDFFEVKNSTAVGTIIGTIVITSIVIGPYLLL